MLNRLGDVCFVDTTGLETSYELRTPEGAILGATVIANQDGLYYSEVHDRGRKSIIVENDPVSNYYYQLMARLDLITHYPFDDKELTYLLSESLRQKLIALYIDAKHLNLPLEMPSC